MDNAIERRAYARIYLRAYACEKSCTLMVENRRYQADLVDLSAGGARLRLINAALDVPNKHPLVFTLDNVAHNGLLANLGAKVCWRNGPEIGIQFDTALDTAVSTLQKLIS